MLIPPSRHPRTLAGKRNGITGLSRFALWLSTIQIETLPLIDLLAVNIEVTDPPLPSLGRRFDSHFGWRLLILAQSRRAATSAPRSRSGVGVSRTWRRHANRSRMTRMYGPAVRCKRFRQPGRCGLASMYPASDWSVCALGHHGYQRACVLISGQASNGPFGSPVFACAGKTDPPSRF